MDLKDKWKLDEEGFHLYIPQRRRPWYNYLSNGAVGLKISHLGDGFSTTLREPRITISNYDFWAPLKGRFVYITDGDVIWNPSFHPSGTALDSYKCSHTPWSTYWIASKNGIEVECTIFLPRQGPMEVLLVTVWNHSEKERSLYLTTLEEFLLYNSFGVDPVYFSWFTDTVMDPSGKTLWLRKNVGAQVMGFYHSGEKPSSYQGSLKQLIAEGTISFPQEIVKPPLSNTMSGGDPYVGAFQWFLTLPPRGTHTLAVVSGVVPLENTSAVQDSKEWENIKRLVPSEMLYQMEYLGDPEGAKEELAAVKSLWKKKVDRSWYVSLPKGIFSFWLRTFFGAQMYQQSTGMVRSTFRGFRDVAQDVMGLCRFEPGVARNILIDLCSHQYLSGRCVRQWNTEGGPADERDFRDLPLWIPVALATYERLCGDPSIWDEEAPYLDSSQKETLLEHSLRGFQYVLQYGDHGLLYMGAGDWNDALSGPGPKGGSTFLNMFAYWALSLLQQIEISEGRQKIFSKYSLPIKEHQDRLYRGVLRYWNGRWFDRAVVGEESPTGAVPGTILGTTGREGADNRIFLLPQAWFTISGMAEQDPEMGNRALTSMLQELETAVGLLKCKPGYTSWDPAAGNLSSLSPGMAENFAVYNHAAAFAVYALFKTGRIEDALRIFRKILPFYKDWQQTKAEPYVLVNFYNGGYYPERLGEGGIPWLTGTVNWLALCLWDYILPLGLAV